MPYVVMDTSISLPATLSPGGSTQNTLTRSNAGGEAGCGTELSYCVLFYSVG
jgi:hypothetical protein